MIVERIRSFYQNKATTEKPNTGWPTGSRFGTCTAQLQFLRRPTESSPEPPQPRDLIRWEDGRAEEEKLNTLLRQLFPNLTGLRQEPFMFPVPVTPSECEALAGRLASRQIWGRVIEGFRPPRVEWDEDRDKPKLFLLPCKACGPFGRRPHEGRCGKNLGFVLDPQAGRLYAPTYIDWIARDKTKRRLVVIEGKSLSNYGFRDVLLGNLDWGRRAQLVGEAVATGLDVLLVAKRKETGHYVELDFSRAAGATTVTITKLSGEQEVYLSKDDGLLKDGEPIDFDKLDYEWEIARTETPFSPAAIEPIQEHIRRVLLFSGPATPGSQAVHRQYEPEFACATCQGTGVQTFAKSGGKALVKGPKSCPDCGATGLLEETELRFPCSYCQCKRACYPFTRLEFHGDGKPHWLVKRGDFEVSGLTLRSKTAAPTPNGTREWNSSTSTS